MNKKSLLALAMAGALSVSLLAGCGDKGGTTTPETTPPAVTDTTTPEVPETTPPVETPIPEETPTETQKPTGAPTATPGPATPPAETGKPATSAVQSTWADIEKLDLPGLMDIDAATLAGLYGIEATDLVEYVCKFPPVNVHATEFFIAEVKEGKMDTVKAAVEKRQADMVGQWDSYLPEQLALVENYKLVVNGNYILFAVSEHADSAVSSFDSYTK